MIKLFPVLASAVLIAGLADRAPRQLAPPATLNPARPHIEIILGPDPPLVRLFGTPNMSGPPLVVVDGDGLHAHGRLGASWPGGRYDGAAPGGMTDMVLGYRDRAATQYAGCRADVPVISTWYQEHGRFPKLFLEVVSRSGSIVRLRSKTRNYFLDVRTLPGCPRIPDPVDDVPCDRQGAWEWFPSQQDEDLRVAINLSQLGGDRVFVEFLRSFRECVNSSKAPGCLRPLVADKVPGNAAGSEKIYVTRDEFVENLWNGEFQGQRLRDIVTGCFTKGSLQPMGRAAEIYFSNWKCWVSDERVLTGLMEIDSDEEGVVNLDKWPTLQPVAPGPPVTVGVLLGSSAQPIARFNGREWVNTWPDPVNTVEPTLPLDRVPPEWLGGPVPPQWVGHLVNGTTIKLTAAEIVGSGAADSGCTSPRRVSFSEGLPEGPGLFDWQHVGVATDRPWRVEAVTPVPKSRAAYKRAEAIARELFAAADRGALAIRSSFEGSAELLLTRRFRETPVVVDAVFASGEGTRLTYYFEASRWLADNVRVFIVGWIAPGLSPGAIVESAGIWMEERPRPTNIKEWMNVAESIPLGVVWMSDGPIWVMETPLGESTAYILYQLGPGTFRTLLRTDGGGC